MDKKQHPLIGKTVTAVFVSEGGGAIRFDVTKGESVVARADGECCSHSWIETVQGVDQLIGSPVVSVEDVDMPDLGSSGHDDEQMAYYGCKITTRKGYALIDYRNSSNGYYGGNLSWVGHDYFFGGVFEQNGSMENWKPVVGGA
jgi:hypothetical protein